MYRFAAILLAMCFLAHGTGMLEYLHNLEHAREDAEEDAKILAAGQPVEHHHHDETNCEVHAQLHMALFFTSWTPVLVFLGLFVAFLTLLAVPVVSHRSPRRIHCRGPPLHLIAAL
jgi:hypothetical protein